MENFSLFHEAIRDVLAWASTIVDDDGNASPRDARWLRAFLSGPLLWHFADKEIVLGARLALRESAFLDACLERASERRGSVAETVEDVLIHLAPLCVGDATNASRYQAAVRRLHAVAEKALRYDDDVILPSAYTFLDPAERAVLTREIASCDATRPWQEVAVAGDAPMIHSVHAVRTRTALGVDAVRSFADCPRRRTAAVETCAACPHLERLTVDCDGKGQVACAIDDTPIPIGGPRVCDIMTRDVLCVEKDAPLAEAVGILASTGVSGMPVVDARGAAVGMITRSDIVDAVHAGESLESLVVADAMMHAAFVVRESDRVEDAARVLVAEGIHRLPVIDARCNVVGILSTLDVLRATVARPRTLALDHPESA